MLAGEIYAPQKIRLIEICQPPANREGDAQAQSDQILFQPELGCLCGSDLTFFEGDYPEFAPEVCQSLHEMIGRVAKSQSSRFQEGDRVLAVPVEHFGLVEQYWLSAYRAIPIDERVSDAEAVLAQPLGTVIYALRKLPNLLDWNVVVVGQGPIGLLHCATLRNLGARHVIALDQLDERLAYSRQMGATDTVNVTRDDPVEAVRRLTDGKMADLVIEAVGHREQVLNLCVDLARAKGAILFFGVPPERIDGVRMKDLFWKNLVVYTSVGPDFTRDFPLAMRWIAEGRIDVKPLITHQLPLAEIQQAFELFHGRKDGALKVFVDFRA